MFGRIFAIAVLVLFDLVPAHPARAESLVVSAVRTGEHVGRTRVVLDVSGDVDFRIFTLVNPYRVVVDLPEVDWQAPTGDSNLKGDIAALRFGRFSVGTSRMVLEVGRPVEVSNAFVLPPQGNQSHRLVIDLAPVDAAQFARTAGAPPSVNKASAVAAGSSGALRRADNRRMVVIDPGHGGVDPGTIGVSGLKEKSVTLEVAQALKRSLESTGRYRVLLTRDSDVFVRLRDRVSIARTAGAELFVSLHADSIKRREVRGASVYTLSEKASDAEAEALAAKENKADIIGGVDLDGESAEVTNILIDLVQRETMNLSASLATLMLPELGKRVRTLHNAHRFAGFAVLKAPDVPSVLVEMGYLSNRQDERLLASSKGRKMVVEALVASIDKFFSDNPS
jgi:N-acetylmuramoyl-L-alanine amidase